jgi:hypothetical protein
MRLEISSKLKNFSNVKLELEADKKKKRGRNLYKLQLKKIKRILR